MIHFTLSHNTRITFLSLDIENKKLKLKKLKWTLLNNNFYSQLPFHSLAVGIGFILKGKKLFSSPRGERGPNPKGTGRNTVYSLRYLSGGNNNDCNHNGIVFFSLRKEYVSYQRGISKSGGWNDSVVLMFYLWGRTRVSEWYFNWFHANSQALEMSIIPED